MSILFIDTETTGMADFHAPPDGPGQPRLVQLAARLTDALGLIDQLNVLIRPDGWTIPAEATRIHGYSTDDCEARGVRIKAPLLICLWDMLAEADTIVAHNVKFDLFILRGEYARLGENDPFGDRERRLVCTMEAMTPICKIPVRWGYKWPTLEEAYRHAFGETFPGAHDAMGDVVACQRVYFWLGEHHPDALSGLSIIDPEIPCTIAADAR